MLFPSGCALNTCLNRCSPTMGNGDRRAWCSRIRVVLLDHVMGARSGYSSTILPLTACKMRSNDYRDHIIRILEVLGLVYNAVVANDVGLDAGRVAGNPGIVDAGPGTE